MFLACERRTMHAASSSTSSSSAICSFLHGQSRRRNRPTFSPRRRDVSPTRRVISCLRRRRSIYSHPSQNPKPSPSDRNIEFSLDLEAIVDRASESLKRFYRSTEGKFHRFLSSGEEAYRDLLTSVRVDSGRRIVFSCRRSSLLFTANLLVWSVVVSVSVRFLWWLASEIRWGPGFGGWSVVRRDRSLGGREVVVGRRLKRKEAEKWNVRAVPNPLSPARGAEIRVPESVLGKRVLIQEKLPEWWPDSVTLPAVTVGKEEFQREANGLVRAIMDNRMSGKDFKEDDIIQLRKICKTSGVKVSFDTANVRDSFYRTTVDFILNTCSRVKQPTTHVHIEGEEVRQFLAGLADNIGLENVRAARIICASVAARTRSCFLQAWALEVQGRRSEALEELLKICLIHQIFPPGEHSPEMEMVARGLEKSLKLEQRAHLFNLLGGVCFAESQRTAAASALGLKSLLNI